MLSTRNPQLFTHLQIPRVDHEGAGLGVEKDAVQHIQGVDRDDSWQEGFLGLAVEGLGGEAAGVNFAPLGHELAEALIDEQVAREGFVTEGGEALLEAERYAGAVEQDGGLKAFAQQAGGYQGVHKSDGAFEGNTVKGHEGLLAGIGLDVLKDFFFIVDKDVAVLVGGDGYFRHDFDELGSRVQRQGLPALSVFDGAL